MGTYDCVPVYKFSDSQRQRCVKHKLDNVLGYIPKQQHTQVWPELRAIFYQESQQKANQKVVACCEKYASLYPLAVELCWPNNTFVR